MTRGVALGPRMALTVGAVVGLAAGLLISAPWAGGQAENECQPLQTVSDSLLEQVGLMNRKLDNAIEDAPDLTPAELHERTGKIENVKHLLIRDFPSLFGSRVLYYYLDLAAIDNNLEDAYQAKSRKGGDPRNQLRAAVRAKDSLEDALRRSPCRPR